MAKNNRIKEKKDDGRIEVIPGNAHIVTVQLLSAINTNMQAILVELRKKNG